MVQRLVVLTAAFLATAVLGARALQPERVPLREPLSSLPLQIGAWTGHDAPRFQADIEAILGADEYLNRLYLAPGQPPVSFYVGYYQSQREGDTIHSPINCLPGAGWEPVETARTDIVVEGRAAPITVNRFIIQKGLDRQVVLYWYQSHGRVVSSEYWSKAYLIYDAMRRNRSDAAMVRVISPILPGEGGDAAAAARATEFVQKVFPHLGRHLPS